MYTTFVAWVYGVTFVSLFGYVGWMLARLKRLEAGRLEQEDRL
ncbi:hypothetical protein [Deinococcus radiodurans]|jgi:hypothetical protein|nr:hypothetical protein [Deinococcus radiodurans]